MPDVFAVMVFLLVEVVFARTLVSAGCSVTLLPLQVGAMRVTGFAIMGL